MSDHLGNIGSLASRGSLLINPLRAKMPLAPPLLAPCLGLVIGVLVGSLPGIVGVAHQITILAPVCLAMAMFCAGLFGAVAAFRRRQWVYAFVFLTVGWLFAQSLFSVQHQLFLVSYVKLLRLSVYEF